MRQQDWRGVFPAITTPFRNDQTVDHDLLRQHTAWLIDRGCDGIVALGSLGEGATLSFAEKVAVLESCRAALGTRAPLVAGIGALSTAESVALAREAHRVGCEGLMVLPPYVYRGDWRETKAHMDAIITATPLSCMLYNNPIAYGIDFVPWQVQALCQHENLHSIKESSGDIRRIAAIRELIDDRLEIFVGIDDLIVEGIAAGATGWIAGLVNAFPEASVRLFELARSGGMDAARELYEWFLPLLRLDVGPHFVQLIKLVQQEVGMGSETVRPPRYLVEGAEREAALAIIRKQMASDPLAAAARSA
jgi:4-hydroxy-tetrahydrodipicolinate synthase